MKAEGSTLEVPAQTGEPPRRLSSIFEELAHGANGTVSVEELRRALGDRSFAALLVFFSLFNLLPWPPGATIITGIPLMLLSVQMVLRRGTVWLPGFILRKSMSARQFRHLSERLVPKIKWLERFIRPRLWPFARDHADRVVGLCALVMALAVTVPIPLGAWLPAFSCALMGLAHSERDGLFFAIGIVVGVLAIALMAFVVGAAGVLAGMLVS